MTTSNSTCKLDIPDRKTAEKFFTYMGLTMEPEELFSTYYKHLALTQQEGEQFKIPPISHHIWLTKPSKSKEVREEDLENLKNTISILDNNSSTNWHHIFWTNCNSCIPKTLEKLAPFNIEVKELSTIRSSLETYSTVTNLINKGDLGKAADLVREDIVNLMGGFYSDLNYIIHKSPENLMKQFDFFVDSEGQIGVENYMFASTSNHPILQYAVSSTLKLLKNPDEILGINTTGCTEEDLTHSLTFGPFCSAFIKNANKYNTIDLALPSREVDAGLWESMTTEINLDGSVTEIYKYPTCSLEGEDSSPMLTYMEKYIEYFRNHMLPSEAGFGKDGENGNTWMNNDQVQQIDNISSE